MFRRTVSAALLVASNLVPLGGVLLLGWTVFSVVFLYWLESVIVIFVGWLKLKRIVAHRRFHYSPTGGDAPSIVRQDLENYPKFYGGFICGHGVLLLAFFWPPDVDLATLAVALPSLLVSHAFSYRQDFIRRREFERIERGEQFMKPFLRILPLHLAIMVAAFALDKAGPRTAGLVTLIVVKIAVDLWVHLRDRSTMSLGRRSPGS